jgi:hypothetical protein
MAMFQAIAAKVRGTPRYSLKGATLLLRRKAIMLKTIKKGITAIGLLAMSVYQSVWTEAAFYE